MPWLRAVRLLLLILALGLGDDAKAQSHNNQGQPTSLAEAVHQFQNNQISHTELKNTFMAAGQKSINPLQSNAIKCTLNPDYATHIDPSALVAYEQQATSTQAQLWLYLVHSCFVTRFHEQHNMHLGRSSVAKLFQHTQAINHPALTLSAHIRAAHHRMQTDLNLEVILHHLEQAEQLMAEADDPNMLIGIVIAKYQLLHTFELTELRDELMQHHFDEKHAESPHFQVVQHVIQAVESCKKTGTKKTINQTCQKYMAALVGINMLSTAMMGEDKNNLTDQDDFSFYFNTILASLMIESDEPLKAEPFVQQQGRILTKLANKTEPHISRALNKEYHYTYHINQAQLHHHKQQHQQALNELMQAQKLFNFTDTSARAFHFYKLKHVLLSAMNRHDEALQAYEKYQPIKQHVQRIVDEQRKRLASAKAQATHIAQQNEVLERTNQRQNESLSQERNIQRWRNHTIGIGALVLLLAGVVTVKQKKQRLQAQHQALTDELTGVFNRTYFYDKLQRYLTRQADDESNMLSVILFDLDYFKSINDQHGHLTGDAVLVQAIAVCQQNIRPSDWIARMGGEEFVVVCPEADSDASQVVAERIRKGIEAMTVVHHEHQIKTTVSLGVAERQANDSNDSLMHRADRALYQAKEMGRNRVVVAS